MPTVESIYFQISYFSGPVYHHQKN